MKRRPVILIVLDGWGLRAQTEANAVALADTPVFDRLMTEYQHTTLRTCGPDVGLPEGQMGNSEVGHMTLGAGAVIDQDLLRIDKAVADGSLCDSPALQGVFEHVRARNSALHLWGLIGEGGVHAHTRHVKGLLACAKAAGLERVFLHAFTDGRDTAPDSGLDFMRDIEAFMAAEGVGRVASVTGRYWAMDRDKRWERTARAWAVLAGIVGTNDAGTDDSGTDDIGTNETAPSRAPSAEAAIAAAHARGETDEFIAPTIVVGPDGRPTAALRDGDGVVLFNFRSDRVRQLLTVATDPDFAGFARRAPSDVRVATMTEYADGQRAEVISPSADVTWPLARVIAEHGLRQFHTAETEKYAHVTYFFNGGRETPFPGEDRRMSPSPKVATYDLAPAMSAADVTDHLVARIREQVDAFILVNYANPDMVGHTGDLAAAIRAVEVADICLGRVLAAIAEVGGAAVVTADHGNCEMMIDPVTGGPHTAHTLNPVPLIVVDDAFRAGAAAEVTLAAGRLSDVAPTILALLGLPAPPAMTGAVLYRPVGTTRLEFV